MFFDELIPMRLAAATSAEDQAPVLSPLYRDAGFIGDPKTRAIQASAEAPRTTYPTSWLPTEALAKAWRELISGKN